MADMIITTCLDCGYPVMATASDKIKGGYRWYCTHKPCANSAGADLSQGKAPTWTRRGVDVSTRTVTGGRETINTTKETA